MSVEFEEERNFNENLRKMENRINTSKISNFLIKNGFAKNQLQANILMLLISTVCLALMFFILYSVIFKTNETNTSSDINDQNNKVMLQYIGQGYVGKSLMDKIAQDKQSGLIK